METDGWTLKRAEEELGNVLADVRRGIWAPPERKGKEAGGAPEAAPRFGPFARGLLAAREGQVSENTLEYLRWGLSHLLPYFANWLLPEIDAEAVDAYRAHKVAEAEARRRAIERRKPKRDDRGRVRRPLSAGSINKTIEVLQWVLSVAVEYRHLSENPAEGRRRRLPVPKRVPVHLDTAEQIEALLDAAAELDREPRWRCSDRHATVATLVFAGPHAQCRDMNGYAGFQALLVRSASAQTYFPNRATAWREGGQPRR